MGTKGPDRSTTKAENREEVNEESADFSDPESQRVLTSVALRLAREFGRQYARELRKAAR